MATAQVKVEHINPFVESVYELFTTMLSAKVERGELTLVGKSATPLGIMGIIGISGETRGVVMVGFPESTALAAVSHLLGTEIAEMDETVSDGIAEIVNMIAGNAKSKLSTSDGTPLDLSLPTVVRGSDYQIDSPNDAVWIGMTFKSELGDFQLRVMFESD